MLRTLRSSCTPIFVVAKPARLAASRRSRQGLLLLFLGKRYADLPRIIKRRYPSKKKHRGTIYKLSPYDPPPKFGGHSVRNVYLVELPLRLSPRSARAMSTRAAENIRHDPMKGSWRKRRREPRKGGASFASPDNCRFCDDEVAREQIIFASLADIDDKDH